MNIPKNYMFSKSDEWVLVEGNTATVGISDFAQEQLSDIVFVEYTLEPGEDAKKGSQFGTVESVKAAADLILPVGGKVIQVNETLADSPEMVNSDPFGKAWMVKLELASKADLEGLMDAAAYEKYCGERSH